MAKFKENLENDIEALWDNRDTKQRDTKQEVGYLQSLKNKVSPQKRLWIAQGATIISVTGIALYQGYQYWTAFSAANKELVDDATKALNSTFNSTVDANNVVNLTNSTLIERRDVEQSGYYNGQVTVGSETYATGNFGPQGGAKSTIILAGGPDTTPQSVINAYGAPLTDLAAQKDYLVSALSVKNMPTDDDAIKELANVQTATTNPRNQKFVLGCDDKATQACVDVALDSSINNKSTKIVFSASHLDGIRYPAGNLSSSTTVDIIANTQDKLTTVAQQGQFFDNMLDKAGLTRDNCASTDFFPGINGQYTLTECGAPGHASVNFYNVTHTSTGSNHQITGGETRLTDRTSDIIGDTPPPYPLTYKILMDAADLTTCSPSNPTYCPKPTPTPAQPAPTSAETSSPAPQASSPTPENVVPSPKPNTVPSPEAETPSLENAPSPSNITGGEPVVKPGLSTGEKVGAAIGGVFGALIIAGAAVAAAIWQRKEAVVNNTPEEVEQGTAPSNPPTRTSSQSSFGGQAPSAAAPGSFATRASSSRGGVVQGIQ
ncbi:MAG: hypothetical protein K0R98_148 [Rickettsiaceae bacterium]|jgi:hypothetical protein|nr:hypothetical protein [Rickettsiaceae bacterium]